MTISLVGSYFSFFFNKNVQVICMLIVPAQDEDFYKLMTLPFLTDLLLLVERLLLPRLKGISADRKVPLMKVLPTKVL